MEYGRLVVLGYSSYRVASKSSSHHADRAGAGLPRSPSGVICTAEMARMKSEKERRVIGQIWEPIGDQNAQYKLTKRSRGNGVKLRRFHHIVDARASMHSVDATKIDLKVVTKRMLQYIDAMQMQTKAHSHTHHSSSHYMCVPMSDTDVHASITEYVEDDTTDMYQIGRMPCVQNDVVIPGPRVGASGTVSRFCARVLCTREAPFECRIFAGGFDGTHKMVTAGHALKRCGRCGEWSKRVELDHKCVREMMEKKTSNQEEVHSEGKAAGGEEFEYYGEAMEDATQVPIDGLTKNGVRVWLPEQRRWFEVSVNGNLYEIAPRTASASTKRSHANPDTSVRHSGFNRPTGGVSATPAILTDGAIIDLGGVQLQFQSRWSNQNSGEESLLRASMALLGDCDESTSDESDSSVASKLDRMNVQCPVQMHQLRFHRAASGETIDSDQVPHVFPACGHVFGFEHRIARSKMCPLCRKPGNFVRLLLKENFQLMSSAERSAVPECVFNPCGHAISSKLAVHYSGLLMPNGRAICPFCAVHLDPTTPYSRLYLYSEDDNGSQLDQQHEREQATST